MKIALAQMNPTIGDFEGNFQKMVAWIRAAREAGCDLIVFPELCVTGYPPQDLLLKRSFVEASVTTVEKLRPHSRDIAIIVGYVEPNPQPGRPLFNTAALLEGGEVRFRTHKTLLPTYDVFDEDRYFEPGRVPALYPFQGWQIGIPICEDIWNDKDYWKIRRYRIDPVELMIQAGANLIVNISASPYTLGKINLRSDMIRNVARKHRAVTILVNMVGANDELIFDGSSRVFNNRGACTYRAPSFTEHLGFLDLNRMEPVDEPEPEEDISFVYQALLLGIRDYTRKCNFSDVLVGVSGGIDSAVTVTLAVDALGPEHVTGVFMPSRYTSQDSYRDARQLAQNLGIRWVEIPIDAMFDAYLGPLRAAVPELGGVPLENLQARIRGNILMTLSNQWGALVLSTGNKSELALGYCTLYGDMTGGLAVLGDIPKTMVYELARFLNRERERIPDRILHKAPSAELRPDQRDEDDIPPYAVVDPVIHYYVEEELSLTEIVDRGIDPHLARSIVERIDRNEYKRRQAPPTLKITSRAFGSGRRFPIAQRFRHPLPETSRTGRDRA